MSRVDEFNRDVSGWSRDTLLRTKNEVLRMCLNIGPGYEQQRVSTQQYAGEASKITFQFPYYMVFVHKGAGRGYGGNKSGLFTRADASKGATADGSKGKMGTGKRMPKPWFNPVIQERFPYLADLVSQYHGDKILINVQRVLID
jgi:hypothetical protein